MGLIERRLIKQGQEEWIPEATKELHELTGGAQILEVDWESFSSDVEALNNVRNQGMRRINSAFRVICRDELGKVAAQESVKKVVLHNLDKPEEKSITLKDGALTVQCAWGKGDKGYYADNEIIRMVEKLL